MFACKVKQITLVGGRFFFSREEFKTVDNFSCVETNIEMGQFSDPIHNIKGKAWIDQMIRALSCDVKIVTRMSEGPKHVIN